MSRLSITPAPSNRSSKSKGKQREVTPHGGGDQDNFLDSHAYNDYGCHRLVSTNSPMCKLSNDKKLQLLISLSSLESRTELVCNNMSSHCAKCAKCKTQKAQDKIEIIADSSTSDCFTHTQSNLSEFEVINDKKGYLYLLVLLLFATPTRYAVTYLGACAVLTPSLGFVIKTASKKNSLRIKGKGVLLITHQVTHKGKTHTIKSRLYPVYYLPGLSHRLISVGHLLNSGLELRGSSSLLSFTATAHNSIWLMMKCKPHTPGQNLYWLSARLTSKHSLLTLSLVHTIDYDIMHRCFAHPSKDVLQHASENTQNFPSNLLFPSLDPVCQDVLKERWLDHHSLCLKDVPKHPLTKFIWI